MPAQALGYNQMRGVLHFLYHTEFSKPLLLGSPASISEPCQRYFLMPQADFVVSPPDWVLRCLPVYATEALLQLDRRLDAAPAVRRW